MKDESEGRIDVYELMGAAWVEISQPARLNALTVDMWDALADTMRRLDADPGVRAVVIRGAGPHFSAGVDLQCLVDELGEAAGRFPVASATGAAECAIVECGKPVIAMIDGYALGGGALVALAADIRIASTRAHLGFPPAKLGIVYPATSLLRLVETVGRSQAKLLLLSGRTIGAEDALRCGLVDIVAEPDAIAATVEELLTDMGRCSLQAQIAAKRGAELATSNPLELPEKTSAWTEALQQSGEQSEGIRAFLAKRQPTFS